MRILYNINSVNCDGAYSSKSKVSEFRVMDTETGNIISHKIYNGGTNNIAEFLAVCQAMSYLKHKGDKSKVIYTDSVTALCWVKTKNINTIYDLEADKKLSKYVESALEFLSGENLREYNIRKWDTRNWGEVPSDFGRK
jgi:ribonuclease HI